MKKFIVGGLIVLVAIIVLTHWSTNKTDKEVINASKLILGEMLIEYPEDLEITDAKVKEIRHSDAFVEYNLTGYVGKKGGMSISAIDVDMHENLKDSPWKWDMQCNSCPQRINPPDDVNSEQYKKWHEIFEQLP